MRYDSRAFLTIAMIVTSLGGCAGSSSSTHSSTTQASRTLITLDGDTSDWTTNAAAWADQHHLYMRFSVDGEPFTLQSARQTTAILLDIDANPATGWKPEATGELSGLGVDVEIQSSPARDGRRSTGEASRFGLAMFTLDAQGNRTPTDPYAWDVSIAPTYAAPWYEARISRTPTTDVSRLPKVGLLGTGDIRGAFVMYTSGGAIDAASEVFTVEAAAPCMGTPRRSTLEVPEKDPRAIRVVSYNVLRSSPESKPEVYTRIFEALKPDIVLVQEWENDDSVELEEWFNERVPVPSGWQAVVLPGTVANGAGVGVVSRYPVTLATSQLVLGADASAGIRDKTSVRFVAAEVDTPMGAFLAGSTHLKSRGSKDSTEDKRRMIEAQRINAAVREALKSMPDAVVVIAGDMNLVGSRPPLDVLRAGLDADGSELAVASAGVLGDRTMTTWSEAGNEFGPGRLDYIVYSDSRARQQAAFVLDTARLADEPLQLANLKRTDTATASDHMPVVVDLVPTNVKRPAR